MKGGKKVSVHVYDNPLFNAEFPDALPEESGVKLERIEEEPVRQDRKDKVLNFNIANRRAFKDIASDFEDQGHTLVGYFRTLDQQNPLETPGPSSFYIEPAARGQESRIHLHPSTFYLEICNFLHFNPHSRFRYLLGQFFLKLPNLTALKLSEIHPRESADFALAICDLWKENRSIPKLKYLELMEMNECPYEEVMKFRKAIQLLSGSLEVLSLVVYNSMALVQLIPARKMLKTLDIELVPDDLKNFIWEPRGYFGTAFLEMVHLVIRGDPLQAFRFLDTVAFPVLETLKLKSSVRVNRPPNFNLPDPLLPKPSYLDLVTNFAVNYDNFHFSRKQVKQLALEMRSVKRLEMALTNQTFPVVCKYWKRLEDLTVVGVKDWTYEGDPGEGPVDDVSITGTYPPDPTIVVKHNLVCLKRLAFFKFESSINIKGSFPGGLRYLTEHSVMNGFLRMKRLKYLEVNVDFMSEKCVRALERSLCVLKRRSSVRDRRYGVDEHRHSFFGQQYSDGKQQQRASKRWQSETLFGHRDSEPPDIPCKQLNIDNGPRDSDSESWNCGMPHSDSDSDSESQGCFPRPRPMCRIV